MAIYVYNRTKEAHFGKNNFPIFRGVSVLANPYTHIKDKKTKALYVVSDRDEAIRQYSHYFDVMYDSNKEFTAEVDRIYEAYKTGEPVYLECYCHPESCHGDIIAEKLRKRLIKEKLDDYRREGKETTAKKIVSE